MTKTTAGVSFASLNARKLGETPFEFEFIGSDGSETGIRFSVLGAQSATVQSAVNALMDERKRKDAIREMEAMGARPGDNLVPHEDEVTFGRRLAAVRLVGWSGLDVDYTPALAMELCSVNADVAAQVIAQSNRLANFTKASPKA